MSINVFASWSEGCNGNDEGEEEDVDEEEERKWAAQYLDECRQNTDWALLQKWEVLWRDHYLFLENRGYRLRPRYHPKWIGSWISTGKDILDCEDSIVNKYSHVLDAMRISDNLKVTLKTVSTRSQEVPINQFFSEKLKSDPNNRAVPTLDIIPFPGNDEYAFLVMPYLRHFNDPNFTTVGECIEAVQQLLQGLQFFHYHNVAHMDACWMNIMMDAKEMIPNGWHHAKTYRHPNALSIWANFAHKSRREVRPVSYYFIDFGLSLQYSNFEKRQLVCGRVGQDKTVPEFLIEKPYDPFMLDIYQLGSVIERLTKEYDGLEFLDPLVKRMKGHDPMQRPDAATALGNFIELTSGLTETKLGNALEHNDPNYTIGPNDVTVTWSKRKY